MTGEQGPPGDACKVDDVVAALIIQIKTDPGLQDILQGPPGDKGDPGETTGLSVVDLTDEDIMGIQSRLQPFKTAWVEDGFRDIQTTPDKVIGEMKSIRLGEVQGLQMKVDIELIKKIVEEAIEQRK